MTNQFVPARDLRSIGARVRIYPGAVIIGPQFIDVGSDVIIDSLAILVASEECPIKLGSFVHVAAHASIAGGPVELGDFAGLSIGARVFGGSDDYDGLVPTNPTLPRGLRSIDRCGVTIGRHAVIGTNAIVLPGCNIPEGVAIGAGSLVNRTSYTERSNQEVYGPAGEARRVEMEPWQIWVGSPARFLRKRAIINTTAEAVRKFVQE